jgi:hypothetical protein
LLQAVTIDTANKLKNNEANCFFMVDPPKVIMDNSFFIAIQ